MSRLEPNNSASASDPAAVDYVKPFAQGSPRNDWKWKIDFLVKLEEAFYP
jgi:hypothetical protein